MPVLFFLYRFGCFLETDNGAITAAATAVIGLFTIALAVFGRRQAILTRSAINLARDEFTASHRPRIILRDVSLIEEGGNLQIWYMLVNAGESKATIVESWVITEVIQRPTIARNLRSTGHNDLGQIEIAGGGIKDIPHIVDDEVARSYIRFGPNSLRLREGSERGWDLYFAGAILYRDNAGNHRRSVFRRRWDINRRSFYRTDDPDQEYAD